MVDLGERLAQVRILVDAGNYFTINRARQFGKTTTLNALAGYLNHEYFVVSMDFQMQMSNAKFKNENSFALAFAKAFIVSFRINKKSEGFVYEAAISRFAESFAMASDSYELVELFQALSALCGDLGGHGFEIYKDNADRIERTNRIVDLACEFETSVVTTHIGVIPADASCEKLSRPRYHSMADRRKMHRHLPH